MPPEELTGSEQRIGQLLLASNIDDVLSSHTAAAGYLGFLRTPWPGSRDAPTASLVAWAEA
jgi:hypothetical protein